MSIAAVIGNFARHLDDAIIAGGPDIFRPSVLPPYRRKTWMPRTRRGMTHFARAASFDHLVGGGLQGEREREPERLRRIEIDHQLELGGLLDRKLGRRRAFENARHVDVG